MSRHAQQSRRSLLRRPAVRWAGVSLGLGAILAGAAFSGLPSGLAPASLATSCATSLTPLTRVNLGGPSVTVDGETWAADPTASPGSDGSAQAVAAGSAGSDGSDGGEQALFGTAHVGDFAYKVAVPGPGRYVTRLYFAEPSSPSNRPGRRILRVNIQGGRPELPHFDIAAAAGRSGHVTRTFTNRVSGKWLEITGTGIVGQPLLNAVEVFRKAPARDCGAGPANTNVTPPAATDAGQLSAAAVPPAPPSTAEKPSQAPQTSTQQQSQQGQQQQSQHGQSTTSPAAGGTPSGPASPGGTGPQASTQVVTAGPLTPDSGRPFSAASAWNQQVPANPALDPRSSAMVSSIASSGRATANLYAYGDPVFTAVAGTPTASVTCTQNWGKCDLEAKPLRIPSEATPTTGSDGRMIVVDLVDHTSCDFWQVRKVDSGHWTASWGTCASLDGDGRGPDGGATGAGVNTLTGVIRTFEIRSGRIPHALSIATGNSCAGRFEAPATKTDGSSSRSDCIPEGARLQLDPSINVDTIPGITPGERAVAHALQTYGAINRDNCGANICVSFEAPIGEADPYPAAGFNGDYDPMAHIPWSRLRVIQG